MNSRSKLTTKSVYHQKLFLLCCFIIFFQPMMLWNRVPFNFFFQALQLLVWGIIAVTQITRLLKWKSYLWVWTIFCIIQIVVIFNNVNEIDANPDSALETTLSYLFLVHFLDIFFSGAQRKEILLFWKYLYIMILIELVSIPLYRFGLISIYWLGIKTRATEPIIAFLLISLILKDKVKKKWIWSGIILSIFIVLILRISTAVVGIALIVFGWWLLRKPHLKWFLKLLQPSIIIAVTLAITIGVLFFDLQTHFSDFFSLVFAKDTTLSGRTWFWADAISKLAMYDNVHHLWGYGFHNVSVWVGWTYIEFYSEAHNQLLQMLHDTGIIGTVLTYVVWYLQLHSMENCLNEKVKNIMACTCFIYLILCIVEIYYYHSYFFIVFAMAARSEEIVNNLNLHQFKWSNGGKNNDTQNNSLLLVRKRRNTRP